MDDLLSAVFYRRSCPPPETLGDYYLAHLAPGDRLTVALHLRECPHCTRELALYAAAERKAVNASDGLLNAAQDALASLVGRVLWAAPVAAAVSALRGTQPVPVAYAAAEIQVMLEVQPATSGYRRRRLVGKVEPPAAAVGVELWSQVDLLDSLLVDRSGYFAFDRLKPGAYILCLRRNGVEVWLEVDVAAQA
jgi:anti-sigma factor RsiW